MLSGVQARVLSLYRSILRAARTKDAATRHAVEAFARHELDKARRIARGNVQHIEHLLRKGERQLAQLRDPNFTGFRFGGGGGSGSGQQRQQ